MWSGTKIEATQHIDQGTYNWVFQLCVVTLIQVLGVMGLVYNISKCTTLQYIIAEVGGNVTVSSCMKGFAGTTAVST